MFKSDIDRVFDERDFYFRAPASLVVLSFPSSLVFPQLSPPSSLKPLEDAGCRQVRGLTVTVNLTGGAAQRWGCIDGSSSLTVSC